MTSSAWLLLVCPSFFPSPNCLYTSQVAGLGGLKLKQDLCAVPLKSGEAHQSVILRISPTGINSFWQGNSLLVGAEQYQLGEGAMQAKWGCLLSLYVRLVSVFALLLFSALFYCVVEVS